jgi:hypothetical protein
LFLFKPQPDYTPLSAGEWQASSGLPVGSCRTLTSRWSLRVLGLGLHLFALPKTIVLSIYLCLFFLKKQQSFIKQPLIKISTQMEEFILIFLYTLVALIAIVSLVTTIMIGKKPEEDEYTTRTKRNYLNLSWIYIVAFGILLVGTLFFSKKLGG